MTSLPPPNLPATIGIPSLWYVHKPLQLPHPLPGGEEQCPVVNRRRQRTLTGRLTAAASEFE